MGDNRPRLSGARSPEPAFAEQAQDPWGLGASPKTRSLLCPLEILHCPLVLLRRRERGESA